MAMDVEVNRAHAAGNDIFGGELQQDDDVVEQDQGDNDEGMVVNDVDDDLPAINNNVENVGTDDEIVEPPE